MLIGFGNARGAGTVDPRGAVVLLLSTLSWAIGSLYGQRAHVAESSLQASGMQMLSGGCCLLIAGTIAGEIPKLQHAAVSWQSIVALGYLVVFGAIIAFTSYSWLLKVASPSRVSTYAYVNPVVAVALGWLALGEPLTGRMLFAMGLIIVAVMVITLAGRQSV